MLTACDHCEGKPGQDALKLLTTSQSFFTQLVLKRILTSFLNDAARLPSRLLLVLDDYHVITSSQIHESLAYLVDHLPPTLHLVILSRSEPALPLARWRARGDLQEIGNDDLRFSPEEVAAFLHQALPVQLPAEQRHALQARLEGWPTGLRLLALALAGKNERQEIEQVLAEFSGSHRYLLDYFALEVLSTLPEARRIFLLQTCLLGRVTASLCAAVTGEVDSEQTLREMERSGLFLQALGGEPPWYRYHSLFAGALQAQARKRLGEEELRLCLSRASAWYEQQDMFAEGIEATLSAGEWTRAAALMESVLTGENHPVMQERVTLLRWLEMLPEQVLEAHPDLCVNYAAALLFTLDRSSPAAMALIEEPLKRAERAYEREGAWGKLGEALSCHAEVARWQGDVTQEQSLARRALTFPPEPPMRWRGASILTVVASEMQKGRPEEARRLTLEGQQLMETLPIPGYSVHGATLMLGEIGWQQGRLHQAEQSVAQVLELGKAHLDELGKYFVEVRTWQEEAHTWKRLRSELEIHVLLSLAYAARSHPAQAEQALKEALTLAQPEGFQRLFLEKGEQLSSLLRTLFRDLREEPLIHFARDLLLAFASQKGEHQATPHAASALLLDPLTEAEQRVLGLLARGRTNPEIAATLVVSINTVKTQVQSIYHKLGARSRWEASEAARRLDLL